MPGNVAYLLLNSISYYSISARHHEVLVIITYSLYNCPRRAKCGKLGCKLMMNEMRKGGYAEEHPGSGLVMRRAYLTLAKVCHAGCKVLIDKATEAITI